MAIADGAGHRPVDHRDRGMAEDRPRQHEHDEDDERQDLVAVALEAVALEDADERQRPDDRVDSLPADDRQPAEEGRQGVAPPTEGGPADHDRGRAGGRPVHRHKADEHVGEVADDDGGNRRPQAQPQADDDGTDDEVDDAHERCRPDPEQLERVAVPLAQRHDVDAALFDPERLVSLGRSVCIHAFPTFLCLPVRLETVTLSCLSSHPTARCGRS